MPGIGVGVAAGSRNDFVVESKLAHYSSAAWFTLSETIHIGITNRICTVHFNK